MNKWKALGLGLLFVILAIWVWASGGDMVGWFIIAPAPYFLAIAGYKFYRDFDMIAQAEEARQLAAAEPPPLPPMTSPGSNRLYVPPPPKNRYR